MRLSSNLTGNGAGLVRQPRVGVGLGSRTALIAKSAEIGLTLDSRKIGAAPRTGDPCQQWTRLLALRLGTIALTSALSASRS